MFLDDAARQPSLREYLIEHLPRRMYPPGTTPAYSNYGTALAGYIVERVSAMPLHEYLEQHLLQTLRMSRSTFRQPLPEHLAPLMSRGYRAASGEPRAFEVVGPWPAGSLSSTAADMAHFMPTRPRGDGDPATHRCGGPRVQGHPCSEATWIVDSRASATRTALNETQRPSGDWRYLPSTTSIPASNSSSLKLRVCRPAQ